MCALNVSGLYFDFILQADELNSRGQGDRVHLYDIFFFKTLTSFPISVIDPL